MTRVDRLVGAVVAVAASAGIVWASNLSLTPSSTSDAVLRLAWRARPERIEDCRPQSEEALEKLPAHMRQAMICDGVAASYRLEVLRAGVMVAEQIVRGGGLRHDRPLYVFREVPMPPGDARITVRFTRVEAQATGRVDKPPDLLPTPEGRVRDDDATAAMGAERRHREGEDRRRQGAEAVPASLSLDGQYHFTPRGVILVTYDPERRELLALRTPRS